MKLVGMLDSPYVRRVAVSLQMLGLPFEHANPSVFRNFDEFRAINPVVKAPTLVCDDGTVLMDSQLMLEYAEALAHPRTLMPSRIDELQDDLRVIGLALAACEKGIQIIYEKDLRPPDKAFAPWVERVTGQVLAAFDGLEKEVARRSRAAATRPFRQAEVTAAVAWHFTQQRIPDVVPASGYPSLVALSGRAEAAAEFCAAPHGDGVYRG